MLAFQIADSKLQVRYNLDNTEEVLELSLAAVSNGQWHVVKVARNLQHVTLILDGGEGRNYNYSRGNPDGSFLMALSDTTYVGWVVSSRQGTTDQDLADSMVLSSLLSSLFPLSSFFSFFPLYIFLITSCHFVQFFCACVLLYYFLPFILCITQFRMNHESLQYNSKTDGTQVSITSFRLTHS